MGKLFLLLSIIVSSALSAYINEAYLSATARSPASLDADRLEDLNYVRVDPFCCCTPSLLTTFSNDTRKMVVKLNPATDLFVYSGSQLLEQNELTSKRIENLKIINGLFSFSDVGVIPPSFPPPRPVPANFKGCEAIDFNNPDDVAKYLSVVDAMENGGTGSYTAKAGSTSAYGRYQFVTKTANSYCGKVSVPGTDCCASWKSVPACQDEMWKKLTADNIGMAQRRHYPVNTCSIYMIHQQGIGGYGWLIGARGNPYKDFPTLKNVVKNNVGRKAWARAEAQGLTTTEDGLRQVMLDYWGQKFGTNDMSSALASNTPPADQNSTTDITEMTRNVDTFTQKVDALREARKNLYREGILLEMKKQYFYLERLFRARNLQGIESSY